MATTPEFGSLVIQPGVTLNMGVSGSSVGSIQVNGILSVRGTSTEPIYTNGGIYYWGSLFVPSSTSSVTFMATNTAWNEQPSSGSIIELRRMNRTGSLLAP